MICGDKEWKHCRVEKRGCEGCYYNEAYKKDIENLIEELTKVRPEMLNDEALKLFNTIMAVLDERDMLKKTVEEQEVIINSLSLTVEQLRGNFHIASNKD